MESIVQALGGLLLKAVPTVVFLIFVHLYLKYIFFRPLQDVLKKRREATEGVREAAAKSLEMAAEKATMYEIALKEARSDMYREQEETRRHWLDHQSNRIEEARHRAHETIQEAGHKIEADTAEARRDLASSSQALALQITEALAGGGVR
jgi:F-type H+-transporting ATPase subunit b